MSKIIQLGAVLIKMVIKSKVQGVAEENWASLVDVLKDFSVDEFEAREIERKFDRISDSIANGVEYESLISRSLEE